MSHLTPELVELVALFCEGDIAPEQAARLEALVADSDDARRYLLDSFQIHSELAYDFGRDSGNLRSAAPAVLASVASSSKSTPRSQPDKFKRRRVFTFAAIAIALPLAIVLGLGAFLRHGGPKDHAGAGSESPPASFARIEEAKDVLWSKDLTRVVASPLPPGSKVAIDRGLVEVAFESGARVVLEGPAEIELQSPSLVDMRFGKLTAKVPVAAHGFSVQTPNATVVDLGTEFGVACRAGQTDVEVFAGEVRLRLPAPPTGNGPQELTLTANRAARVNGAPARGNLKIEPLAIGTVSFVQSIAASAARLQALMASDPHLSHFYPFDGSTNAERLRDRRGSLDLHEVAMRDGDGDRPLDFMHTGPDPSIQVAHTSRADHLGAVHGRELQSQVVFHPPAAMTIELLLNLSRVEPKSQAGFIACAVATRHDADRCGFLVTAVGDSELACLFDGSAEWLESGFRFAPDHWYYLATTFRVEGTNTDVDSFAADLSDKTPALEWIVRNQVAPGVPAAGLLGIGMGSDGKMANAYPWPGQIGLVAIYDTVLERQTLENHFKALSPRAVVRLDSTAAK